jgi:SEL1 protein
MSELIQGDSIAQYGMGILHILGAGDVPKDQGKALQYFKASAEQNYSPAQVAIAKMYLEQNEIIIATRYFELAARQGHVEAFYYLAELNHKGIGREKHCGTAAAYYKIVSERVEVLHSTLGEALTAWNEGRFTDSMVGYMMAAEQGYECGQANVAYLIDQCTLLDSDLLTLAQTKGRQFILKFLNKPRNFEADNMALIYWTRSARQANTDSLVKMGDWYLYGYGIPSPDPMKAAACYQAAVESMSAMGMWNLGWCHENGIGVEQDFHLAKRYYDMAAATNAEAALPVSLSLIKLRIRSFYNKITRGKVNSIGQDDLAVKIEQKPKWTFTQAFKDILRKWTENEIPPAEQKEEYISDGYMPADPDFEDFDEDYTESLVILGLCGAVAFLLWWRNMRDVRLQGDQRVVGGNDGGNPENAAPAVEEENRGLFPDPNDPNNPEFARWMGGAPFA